MREGTTSSLTAADWPYNEFYDFYSLSPEYFEQTLVYFFTGSTTISKMHFISLKISFPLTCFQVWL
jgi:hypothetical protein